jgi:carbon-monoxide dehydrogenase small subunit
MSKPEIALTVNGRPCQLEVEPDRTLLEVLREELGLTGVKPCCLRGECGACTVLLNGEPVTSCLVLAVDADGCAITTIEGIAKEGRLHPLQQAFLNHASFQCGYCASGVILSAKALLDRSSHPTEDEIREAIAGNICRCTGYVRIVEAIQSVAESNIVKTIQAVAGSGRT